MEALVIVTYENHKYGEPPQAILELKDRDPKQLYCDWIRKTDRHGWGKHDNKTILEDSCDMWHVMTVPTDDM